MDEAPDRATPSGVHVALWGAGVLYCRELIRDFIAARNGHLKEPVAVTRARRWVLFGMVLTVLFIPAVAMAAVLHLRRPIIYTLLGVALCGVAISAVASVVLGASEATARRANPPRG